MSLMPKLMEINDELVRVREERDRLREERDQAVGNAVRLQAQLAEVKSQLEAVVRERYNLQAERNTLDKQLQNVLFEQEEADDAPTEPKKPKKPVKTSAGQNDLVRDVSHYIEAAEVDRPTTIHPPEYTPPEGWRLLQDGETLQKGDMWVRPGDGRTYPTKRVGSTTVGPLKRLYIRQIEPEPQFKPYTFTAYIVGDKIQPDALRIVWATEEWIEQSKFGIVHRMRDMHLFDNDGGCNITEYHETLTLTLKVQ